MAAAEKLYSPELLGLAVSLAAYPPEPDLPLHGSARSRSCGSTLEADISIDSDGRIARLGLKVRACAVGQAAAAIFARAASGRSGDEIEAAGQAIAAWLAEGGEIPQWPGLEALVPAREFSGRHGAIMLPWKAASLALSTVSSAR